MISIPYYSRSLTPETPEGVALVSLFCIALTFAAALYSLNAAGGWMLDDLFSLWASDQATPFSVALQERILPDSNPPLYFSLLYFVRQIIPGDGAAVIALNVSAVVAASAAVYVPSRRLGLSGLAIAGIAAFALSGPALYFASGGRAYLSALAIVFVTSWYASLAITGFPAQLNLARATTLGALAALTHVYAALFCGCMAAGLLALALLLRRKDLVKHGLALGLSATAVFGLWLIYAFDSAGNLDWIEFTRGWVLNAALSVKELALGANLQVLAALALFAFGLFHERTRPLFIAFCIAFSLFVLLPVLASFVRPIITARYWLIGAAALPVLMVFAARMWILEGFAGRSRKALMAGGAALCFLMISSALGFANARLYTSLKPIWRGVDVVRPLLSQCPSGPIHVYYGNSGKPYAAWDSAIWSFARLTGASPKLFADPQEDATPSVSAATSPCPVLGWAEHAKSLANFSEADLLKLLKIEAGPSGVDFVRHFRGFVVLRRDRTVPAS